MKKPFSILPLILLASINVYADSEIVFQPYSLETADKKYIFVMLGNIGPQGDLLRQSGKYPLSGLYLNDGSRTPLWTVDWPGFVILPADGIHLVRRGPWPRHEEGYNDEALSFFAKGKLLKRYSVRDLVDFPWLLPRSVSHYAWEQVLPANSPFDKVTFRLLDGSESYEENQGVVIDNGAGTLKLATLNGEEYVFDLKSGGILQANRPMRKKVALSLILVSAIYLIYLWRASAKPEKLFAQIRWKLLFMPLMAVASLIIFFITLLGLIEVLPEAWARHLSMPEWLGQSFEALFLTLFHLPFVIFRIDNFGIRRQLETGLVIWPIVFWLVIFFLLSLLNFLLIKATRRMRVRYLAKQGDNAAL
jgi:hypothetical protein